MIFSITRKSKQIAGAVNLSGSKSISNRVLIIEALSGKSVKKSNLSTANDTKLLQSLLQTNASTFDAQDAGTAFRFLTAYLAWKEGEWILTGTERMQQRPVGGLVRALQSLGAEISYLGKENFPPLKISGGRLKGNRVKISAGISSQFVSALLMIAPLMPEGLMVELEGKTVSEPYIKMTLELMNRFGVSHQWSGGAIQVPAQTYQPAEIFIESDWSAASYYYEMATVAEEVDITLNGLLADSIQGDSVLAQLMKSFGVETTFHHRAIRLTKSSAPVTAAKFNLADYPDLAPALFVTAAALGHPVSFSGLEHLAYKESHRENALRSELQRGGVAVENHNGEILVTGKFSAEKPLFKTYSDHRMAMALAPLALICPEVLIEDPWVVKKSYPDYWDDLVSVGFDVNRNP